MPGNIIQAGGDSQGATTVQPHSLRIVLVANVRLYREGLAAELGARPGFSMVGLAADFDGAVDAVRSMHPDVVLLDIGTPGIFDLVRAVNATHADARIVAFAVDECERDIEVCAEAGVTGFVTRDVTVDGLAAAITAAVRGELACSPRAAALLFRRVAALSTVSQAMRSERSLLATLTAREREIASHIVGGRSNKEIGRTLNIELATVKNHIHHILEKLRVTTRTEAAARVRVLAERGDYKAVHKYGNI
jgi:two-component system, NarL family, nitrate/nitrite response regulator NarL